MPTDEKSDSVAAGEPEPLLPSIYLKAGQDRRTIGGHPWIYSNEIRMDDAARSLDPGMVTRVRRVDGKPLGIGFFNPRTLIAVRMLSADPHARIDAAFLAGRLRAALALRERFFPQPYYRLIHAEADGLPGLVIDRFGSTLAVQANTAGMERLMPKVLDALEAVLAPDVIVLRGDSPARALEGLPADTSLAKGSFEGAIELHEDDLTFFADVIGGQKTGWYFDQRPNRALVAPLARGERMLDVFCHTGAFAIRAAAAGATEAIGVDSSQSALDLAARSARACRVDRLCRFRRGDAFTELARLSEAGERFRLVVADPPAFAKSRKDLPTARKGYRKLAKMATEVVEPGGFLFIASCSHVVESAVFAEEVALGIIRAGRTGRIVCQAGAGPDHPLHLRLPETAYLKALLIQLD